MRIAVLSHAYAPAFGGIETMSRVLAKELTARGHEVRVITKTPGDPEVDGIPVIRTSDFAALREQAKWSDIWYQNQVSMTTIFPGVLARKPYFITHQTRWSNDEDGSVPWRFRVKLLFCRLATNIAISQSVADTLPMSSVIIPNLYDAAVFRVTSSAPRTKDIAFLARLVSAKGGDLLVDAVKMLAAKGVSPTTTIIGDGPERPVLQERVLAAGLSHVIAFAGVLEGEALARELGKHRILAVPSRWKEPFGIVALEGLGCGCIPVVSDGGGLPEAIGPHGFVFRRNDGEDLARKLEEALRPEGAKVMAGVDLHLAKFTHGAITERYIELFEQVRKRK